MCKNDHMQQAHPIKEPLTSALTILIIPTQECLKGLKCPLTFKRWAHDHQLQASLSITMFATILQLDMNKKIYICFQR